jgi:hypothetical protein
MSEEEPAAKRQALESDLHELRAAERRTQRELLQHRRRESALVLRLALKEREHVELRQEVMELKQRLQPAQTEETTLLCDPAVNAEIMRLRVEVQLARRKEQEAREELQASQYQSGSIAGKMLMDKCKALMAENEQLGKDLSAGEVQKLRADLALQRQYASELQGALAETREWVEMFSDELDTSQAIVLSQRRELNALKSKVEAAEKDKS